MTIRWLAALALAAGVQWAQAQNPNEAALPDQGGSFLPPGTDVGPTPIPPDVEKCARRLGRDSPDWIEVHYDSKILCDKKKNPPYRSAPVNYKIRLRGGRFEVEQKVQFVYRGEARNYSSVMARLRALKTCAEKFFARNGADLHLQFEVLPGSAPQTQDTVELWDDLPRSSSSRWTLLKEGWTELGPVQNCALAAHELGHLLGFPDRYADPECPDRDALGPAGDIMRDGSWSDPATATIHPADLKTLAAPLCEGK